MAMSWAAIAKNGHEVYEKNRINTNKFGFPIPLKKGVLFREDEIRDIIRELRIPCNDAARALIAKYVGKPYSTYYMSGNTCLCYKGFNLQREWGLTEDEFPSELKSFKKYYAQKRYFEYLWIDEEIPKTPEIFDLTKFYYRIEFNYIPIYSKEDQDREIVILFYKNEKDMHRRENNIYKIYQNDRIKHPDAIYHKKRHQTMCKVLVPQFKV